MELNQLKQSVKNLREVITEFPVGAISLDDFKPIEQKIETIRETVKLLNARILMLEAKSKQYMRDNEPRRTKNETENELQKVISDKLINAKAIKLCLHSATILSILNNKEGSTEDKQNLYDYMNKLFTFNDKIISLQTSIENESQVQLDLKVECQKALADYTHFLKEQEKLQNERLQKIYPEVIRQKTKMESVLVKVNITKKLIRSFIAASHNMLRKEPLLSEILEKHRDLLNVETILKMCQSQHKV